IMLHPQINAHKESLPFLMSKKWEAVHNVMPGLFKQDKLNQVNPAGRLRGQSAADCHERGAKRT
ncbi:hypothetical protein, partial [Collinsella aerofaciens]|uniref:hypothetical protein n=1 Tax=Collinsella aerofaciens TaxID=74426 RepID=UPI001E44E038